MNEISCNVCMDLMPLVWDGVAAEESRQTVEHHIESCPDCRAIYEGGKLPEPDAEKALSQTVKRVQKIVAVGVGLVVLLGIILCELVMQGSSMIFVIVVLLIGNLFRVAFSGKNKHPVKRIAALVFALALTWGVIWSGNELFGNPITKAKAEAHIQGYLEGAFADSDYYIDEVCYTWSGSYEGCIRSQSDPELEFYVSYRDGEIIYDTYREHVLDIWE